MEAFPSSADDYTPSLEEDPALGLSHRAKMEVLFAVMLGLFLGALDQTVAAEFFVARRWLVRRCRSAAEAAAHRACRRRCAVGAPFSTRGSRRPRADRAVELPAG
jgi:hypothetical protein